VRIYYKTPSVLVTDEVIHVDGRPARRIATLDSLYVVEVRLPMAPRWTDPRSGQAVVTTLASFAVAIHDLTSGAGAPFLLPALVLGVGGLAFLVVGRNAGTVGELWAVTCTGNVCLFRSRNRDTIVQIRRAVTDALEGRRP
jgi:hypothetical protein